MQQMKWLAAALSVVVLAGCNGTSGSGRSVDVDFLWVRTSGSDEVGEGGSTHAILTVEKSDAGMHVGVFESKPGGTGDMWRAAVWVAALTGTLTLKKNPLDYRYSVELEPLTERVDGPSAGGLFAVGIMAAISGQSVNSDYTMTGTINPDGTIGPVGGVPQKLKAAAAKGKTRFCYPAGQRFDTGPDGESIDVEEEARKLNIEAREVEDLSQAYACVTDKKLPKVEPVSRTQMALSAPVFDLLRQQGEKWLGYCQQEYSAAQKLQHPELYQSLWDLASAEYDDAAKLMKEGLVAAGYWKALTAYVWARTVLLCTATAQGLVSDDPTKALDLFNTIQADAQKNMEKMFSWLAQANPDTVNKTISVLDSYEAAISAVVSHEFAKAAYAELMGQVKSAVEAGAPQEVLVELLAELYSPSGPVGQMVLAEVNALMAKDNLEITGVAEKSKAYGLRRIDDVAYLFQGAASANIEYFNAIFVKEIADAFGMSLDAVTAIFLEKEPNYRVAQFNLKLPEAGTLGYTASGPASSLAKLSGALSSFFASSMLVAKYYSIGAKMDENGTLIGVQREKALIAALSLAEEKARENAALALKYAGAIPESAKISYQIALVLRERPSYQDKLDSLEQFWRSSVWSSVAVYLARLEKGAKKKEKQ